MTEVRRWLFSLLLVMAFSGLTTAQDYHFSDSPLRTVFTTIESQSSFRFLYLDGLIADKRVSFTASEADVLSRLASALAPTGLALDVDADRKQVLVVSRRPTIKAVRRTINGTVVNGQTSDRLPHATISWNTPRGLTGVATNEYGRFVVEFDSLLAPLTLTASYVGFESARIVVDPNDIPDHLPFRLNPTVSFGSEVLVVAPALRASLDTTFFHVLDGTRFAPLGETGVLRSLQVLPSVSTGVAMSSGLNVRGSRVDGFQVLLDGISIYSQSHLFGMYDAFNSDALQAVDFYYDIAPARLQGPPGGTLSFLTRSGSRRSLAGTVALTNASLAATLEGPISDGRSSWLLSARKSYMNAVNWFDNDALISAGLNVVRDNSASRPGIEDRTLIPGPSHGSFYDIHAKISHEATDGSRFQISGYVGGDDASNDSQRLVLSPDSVPGRLHLTDVTTASKWDNVSISLRDDRRAWASGLASTTVAVSHFRSDYRKDDYFYRVRPGPGNSSPVQIAPFSNYNQVTEVKLSHQSTLFPASVSTITIGGSLQGFSVDYDELSALRTGFSSSVRTSLLDLFAELETSPLERLSVDTGLRLHYYANGSFFRASPRFSATLDFARGVTVSAGYSRVYQFLHRLYVEHSPATDVWVLSTADEPPGAVDHLTAGIGFLSGKTSFSINGYAKWHQNLRRHQTVLAPEGIPEESPILSPWVDDALSRALGWEFLAQFRLHRLLSLSTSYTLSSTELEQPDVNGGAYFPADWDRRHQLNIRADQNLTRAVSLTWNLTIASGEPNYFAYVDPREPERLPYYRRLDLSFAFSPAPTKRDLTLSLSFYNLLNTNNVWYRSAETVLRPGNPNRPLAIQFVDVYDLGFHPSFRIRLAF